MPVQGIGHIFNDDVSGAVFHLEVVDGGNVGVVKSGCEPGFPLEGLQVLGVVSDQLVDDLDGNDTVQRGIPGAVDRPWPPAAIRSRISYLPILWSIAVAEDYNGSTLCGWTGTQRGIWPRLWRY